MSKNREVADAELALDVRDLSYSFKAHKALDGVSFHVEPGSIHGFVGPNGAGKTTTLKIISTLLVPKKNKVSVFGMDVVKQQKKVRRFTGFMPDNFAMYRPMKVFEYLDFFAAAYGQTLEKRNQTIDDVLQLTDMAARKNHLIKGLSRGMQQRVCLARVLVHDPELLLLDEPASGLDPRARIELMEILRELKALGKTIFISSHILSELGDPVRLGDDHRPRPGEATRAPCPASSRPPAATKQSSTSSLKERGDRPRRLCFRRPFEQVKSVERVEHTEFPTWRIRLRRAPGSRSQQRF